MFYMSRPFYTGQELKDETKEFEETCRVCEDYFNLTKVIELGKYKTIVCADKEKSQNPESLWMIDTPHTNWVYMTDESLDRKGEGGFYEK